MLIVQIVITLSIGILFSVGLVAIVFGLTQFGSADEIDLRIRTPIVIILCLLVTYLIGIVVVNALGGFYGLSELLR